ncbi:hypothetical protein HOO65_020913 [Ceratocystis lukuohia]|uniref:Helicase ATP-binding domain-containing protein n=1 Tax=Ceratocystis lukuohia TaxID=2019550 RepID=A0ABR4MQ07_9PEZI
MEASSEESERLAPSPSAPLQRSRSRASTRSPSPANSTAPSTPITPSTTSGATSFVSAATIRNEETKVQNHSPSPPTRRRKKAQFVPSEEQKRIVELSKDHNVLVSARPGSGKTSTAEALVAGAGPSERIAILTYSRRLCVETKKRLEKYSSSCSVLTFHAMACRLFGSSLHTDAQLLGELKRLNRGEGKPLHWSGRPYDIIVLDEFQDCTPLLFWLICIFIRVNNRTLGKSARLVILGDDKQAIYGFRKADARFLNFAPDLLGPLSPEYPWAKQTLSKSFRLSHQTVDFINTVYLEGQKYMLGSKSGPMPIFLNANIFKPGPIAAKLMSLINKYRAENTAILAPSVRGSQIMSGLVNILAEEYGVPIAVSTNDDAPLDERVIKGKVSAATIHQFKGSERDLVILLGVSNHSYFNFIARDAPDDHCTNQIFVGLTRAREQLVVVNYSKEPLLSFLSVDDIPDKAIWDKTRDIPVTENELICGPKPGRPAQNGLLLNSKLSVIDVVRFIPDEELQALIDRYLDIQTISPALPENEQINLPVIIPTKWNIQKPREDKSDKGSEDQFYPQDDWNFHEAVSDLNGLAVVAVCEHKMLGTLTTLIPPDEACNDNTDLKVLNSWLGENLTKENVHWLCQKACEYESKRSKFKPRFLQMQTQECDWITPEDLTAARTRLNEELTNSPYGKSLGFEVSFKHEYTIDNETTQFMGMADIIGVKADPKKEESKEDSKKSDTTTNPPDSASISRKFSRKHSACLWEIKFVSTLTNEHILQTILYAQLFTVEHKCLPEVILLFNVRTGEKLQIKIKERADGISPEKLLARFTEQVFRIKFTTAAISEDDEFIMDNLMTREEAIAVVDRPGVALVKDENKVYKDEEVIQAWKDNEGTTFEQDDNNDVAHLKNKEENSS